MTHLNQQRYIMQKLIACGGFAVALYLILKVCFHQSVNVSIGWTGLFIGLLFLYFCLHEAEKNSSR